jgi:hypothetical protein
MARQKELQADQLARVLTAIAQWQPQSAELRQLQASEYHYFANNAERMRYGTFTRKGYHIGSGVVESGYGHVLRRRLDQAGMHWRRETAEAIACLRAALYSTHPPDLRSYCSRVT